jgi:predicted amidophosphoribosyltransferase
MRLNQRQKMEKYRRSVGLCPRCGKDVDDKEYIQCSGCRAYMLTKLNAYNIRQKAKANDNRRSSI